MSPSKMLCAILLRPTPDVSRLASPYIRNQSNEEEALQRSLLANICALFNTEKPGAPVFFGVGESSMLFLMASSVDAGLIVFSGSLWICIPEKSIPIGD